MELERPTLPKALAAGAIGATTLTVAHQALRAVAHDAPRMDRLGARALRRGLHALRLPAPRGRALQRAALAGDLITNTLYYALTLTGRDPMGRGALLGTVAGLGAVALPPMLGLGRRARGVTPLGKGLTMGLYLLGGVATAIAARALLRPRELRAWQPQM